MTAIAHECNAAMETGNTKRKQSWKVFKTLRFQMQIFLQASLTIDERMAEWINFLNTTF